MCRIVCELLSGAYAGYGYTFDDGKERAMGYVCSCMDMAEYTVTRCSDDGRPVTDLHLQKMLYFLQLGFCSATAGMDLLFPEEFQAWRYGPVLPSVYDRFSVYGGGSINRSFECKRLNDILSTRPNMKSFIDNTIDALRMKSPWDLVAQTHADGTPWDKVKTERGYRATIPNSLIIEQARRLA